MFTVHISKLDNSAKFLILIYSWFMLIV